MLKKMTWAEGTLMGKLEHQNVLQSLGMVEDNNVIWIALEYMVCHHLAGGSSGCCCWVLGAVADVAECCWLLAAGCWLLLRVLLGAGC